MEDLIVGNIARNETNRIGKIEEVIISQEGTSYLGKTLEDNKEWKSNNPIFISDSYEEYVKNTSELLNSFLNKDRYPEIAQYVINSFDKYNTSDNLEYEFRLAKGKMEANKINTTFKFDPDEDNILFKISKELYRQDIELVSEHYEFIFNFLKGLKQYFNDNCIEDIRNKIRKYVIANADSKVFPLNTITIENIEINDDRKEYPISVQKNVPYIKQVIKGKTKMVPKDDGYQPESISVELMNLHETTGKDYIEILAEKKALGDPRYRYVDKVILGKRFKYIFHLDMNIDYSATDPEILAKDIKK